MRIKPLKPGKAVFLPLAQDFSALVAVGMVLAQPRAPLLPGFLSAVLLFRRPILSLM